MQLSPTSGDKRLLAEKTCVTSLGTTACEPSVAQSQRPMGGSALTQPEACISAVSMTEAQEAPLTVTRKPGNMSLWAALRAANGFRANLRAAKKDLTALSNDLEGLEARCSHGHVKCSSLHDTRTLMQQEDCSNEEPVEVRRREARRAPKKVSVVTPEMWRILEEAQERVRSGKVRFS